MILQSLVRYYEILAKDGLLPREGYCLANVSYALNLSADGKLLSVVTLKKPEQRGKKLMDVPQTMMVPEQKVRTGNPVPYFLCDNSSYLLSYDGKGDPKRTKTYFESARDLHLNILSGINTAMAKAISLFFESWEPKSAQEHPAVQEKNEEILTGGNCIFMLDGGSFAQDDPEILRAWDAYRKDLEKNPEMPCLVTGKTEPVAILHGKIKGVQDAQSAGANLVSFNADAYESYGLEQGMNAPVGEYAAFAYATALNYLLADKEHRLSFGDTTVVFWAESARPEYRNIFTSTINPQEENAEKLLGSVMTKLARGEPIAENVELTTPFYILGLAPNAARLSVRFFLRDSFGNFLDHLRKHYARLAIVKLPYDFPYLSPYWMLRETVNPNARDKSASPLMAGETIRAILTDTPYPDALLEAVMLRIRAEHDDEEKHTKKITSGRAAILKACLLKKSDAKNDKEVLTVSLNEDSKIVPYVLGRLFAALEKAQRDANPGINSTIKDRYFSSACATPGSVFPILLKLYENHMEKIRKMENGKAITIFNSKLVGSLMDKLEVENSPFPAHLLINDQSLFVLGYYHQVQSFFTPKNQKSE